MYAKKDIKEKRIIILGRLGGWLALTCTVNGLYDGLKSGRGMKCYAKSHLDNDTSSSWVCVSINRVRPGMEQLYVFMRASRGSRCGEKAGIYFGYILYPFQMACHLFKITKLRQHFSKI